MLLHTACSRVPVQGLAAVEHCSLASRPHFTFWDLFYPWVLWYLIVYYLKGVQLLSDIGWPRRCPTPASVRTAPSAG